MSKYQRQLKISEYQLAILFDIKCGATLHVNEPPTYKSWLQYPDGNKRFIRFDSAVKIKKFGKLND